MFEQELQMEKRASSILPLLLLVILIVGIVGVALYFVAENRKTLTPAEATPIIQQSIDNQVPVTVRFRIGTLKSDSGEDVKNPLYRLLEKAGYVNIGKPTKAGDVAVSLTSDGQALLDSIPGVKKVKKDDNDEYTLPLARRRLVKVGKITMDPPSKAVVEYAWKWVPNKAGETFDAAGDLVKSFGTYERSELIERYGANFYHEDPNPVQVLLVKGDNGWQVSTQR